MTIVVAFLCASFVMTFGFFLGALMSAAKVADLEDRNAWLIEQFCGGDDPDVLVERFREQIDELDYPDDV